MLIRWATDNDLGKWFILATEMSPIFRHPSDMAKDPEFITYARSKVGKFEAVIAVDYMSGDCLGVIGFSRNNNRISWFGVTEKYRNKGAGSKLLRTALNQLDNKKLITVETFPEGFEPGAPAKKLYRKFGFVETESNLTGLFDLPICRMTLDLSGEKRGRSFHYKYLEYDKCSKEENCPPCLNLPMPEGQIDIAELEYSFATAERVAQGKLFGKMHMTAKLHVIDFEEMLKDEMIGFMCEVQLVAKALHKITGAIKINYEIHSNTVPHIHCHLFPRYLDDDFGGKGIDVTITEPSPYESEDEYLWFVEQMRKELRKV
ncbi:MAG: GNAT family N-acetyltransferase [Saccharofermentanales bacterium]